MNTNLHKLGSILMLAILALVITLGLHSPSAQAGQYDIIYLERSGTNGVNLFPPGTSGTYLALSSTDANGVVQTTGSGLAVNPGPILTSTATMAAESGTTFYQGELGLSSSNTAVMFTGTNWKNVP